ncbi:magnesium transporter CorA family protein [Streptomyces griseofuscus]|uniref:magnesium transporter CorA family protein n=1 Tax=Streptomyces griseofuscus TaxID=146922 RepID=UPI00367DE09F
MVTRSQLYHDGTLVLDDLPVSDVPAHLADPASVLWLDLHRPGAAELTMLDREFGIHELALEDAAQRGQRPKLDRCRTHEFLSAYAVTVSPDGAQLTYSEIAVFLTGQAMITVRKDDGLDIEDVVARWDESPDLAGHGVGFLVHGLLGHLVDGHFVAVQQLDDSIEELEGLLFAAGRREIEAVQRGSSHCANRSSGCAEFVLPMREVVNGLRRPGLHLITDPLVPYYQDVYDHVLRATEWTESLRDPAASVMETNLSVQANSMNLIMKKVTSWAAIIAVPTAITGYCGQNLPYPGFGRESGFITSAAVIVLLPALLYLTFKHKDWL